MVDNPLAVFEGQSLPWVPELDEDVGLESGGDAIAEAQEVLVFLVCSQGDRLVRVAPGMNVEHDY